MFENRLGRGKRMAGMVRGNPGHRLGSRHEGYPVSHGLQRLDLQSRAPEHWIYGYVDVPVEFRHGVDNPAELKRMRDGAKRITNRAGDAKLDFFQNVWSIARGSCKIEDRRDIERVGTCEIADQQRFSGASFPQRQEVIR